LNRTGQICPLNFFPWLIVRGATARPRMIKVESLILLRVIAGPPKAEFELLAGKRSEALHFYLIQASHLAK
jgi:hypothetical protein